MQYYKVKFFSGTVTEGYQEVSEGNQVRLTDLDGNTIEGDWSCCISDQNPQIPLWGTPDV